MSFARWDGKDLLLWIKVQPRAREDAFCEVLGDALKIRIKAPPVDGKANHHLVSWLAGQFGVNRRSVEVQSGHSGTRKLIRIRNPVELPPAVAEKLL